jgi:hypothetical protein
MSPQEWTELIVTLMVAVLGSNVLTAVITIKASRKDKELDRECADKAEFSLIMETLRAMMYIVMTLKIEHLLNQGYATPEQRKEIEELHELYHKHDWNGDMDSRIAKIYSLPTKPIYNRRKDDLGYTGEERRKGDKNAQSS